MPYSLDTLPPPNHSNEHDLLIKFREGDQAAFKTIYECFFTLIYVYCYNLLKSQYEARDEAQYEAQDITTETFVKLWRLRTGFSTLTTVKAFLYITSKNACMDSFRRRSRTRSIHKEIKHLDAQMPEELAILDAYVYIELSNEVEKLPHHCKAIFKLIFHQNMSTKEVAEKMGISNQNVLNQKAKAIRILRDWLMSKNQLVLLTILEELCRNK